MNKKTLYTVIFFIGICQTAFSQVLHTSEKYYYSFEAPLKIERYDTESERVVGFENNDLAVDTEIFYANEVASDYFDNLSKTTESIASQLSLNKVQTAQKLPAAEYGYYVRSTDTDDGENTPVFVVVMYNREKKIVYETTIYCYKVPVEVGKKIARSFKLTQ